MTSFLPLQLHATLTVCLHSQLVPSTFSVNPHRSLIFFVDPLFFIRHTPVFQKITDVQTSWKYKSQTLLESKEGRTQGGGWMALYPDSGGPCKQVKEESHKNTRGSPLCCTETLTWEYSEESDPYSDKPLFSATYDRSKNLVPVLLGVIGLSESLLT